MLRRQLAENAGFSWSGSEYYLRLGSGPCSTSLDAWLAARSWPFRWKIRTVAENLQRAELTKLQHDEQVAEWIRLTEVGLSQVATNPRGGRPGAVTAAAKEIGVDKDAAHRAVKVDSLSPEAKAAAVEHGLDNNRSALLEAAKENRRNVSPKLLQFPPWLLMTTFPCPSAFRMAIWAPMMGHPLSAALISISIANCHLGRSSVALGSFFMK